MRIYAIAAWCKGSRALHGDYDHLLPFGLSQSIVAKH